MEISRTSRNQNKNKKIFKRIKYINSRHITIIFFFIFSIVFVYANKRYLLSGSDFGFHRVRLLGLVQSIENKVFFPKINYLMANGLGYGVPMFYGQWFLYFPALLMSIFNFTFVQSWLSLYVIYYITMLSLNYFIGKKFLMNAYRSIIFSLLLVFNPLITSVVNGDLPFAICLMLTPSLFYCLWRILYFEEDYFILLAVLVAIIFNTHMLSTLVVVFIGFLWMLLNFKKITLHKIYIVIKAILLFILLSASFLLPLLEQMSAQKLRGSGISDAFRYNSVHGLGTIFINSLNDSIASITRYPTISIVGLLLYLISIILYKKSNEFNKKLFLLISFLLIFSSSLFPWVFFGHTLIGAVQFVGRYLVFATVLIILSSAQNKNISTFILFFCLCVTFLSTISQQILPGLSNEEALNEYISGEANLKEKEKYKDLNNVSDLLNGKQQINGVSGGEYLNNSADLMLNNDGMIKSEAAEILNLRKDYGCISFDYKLKDDVDSANIIVPFLWYKGYTAEYSKGGEGTQPSLHYEANTGKVANDGKIAINVKKSGWVKISYHKTFIQRISSIISVACWFYLFILLVKKRKKLK